MTENSPASTQPSNDTINVLPILSEAKAPVSLTLTVDKSVSKVAGWVLAVLLGALVAFSFLSAYALFKSQQAFDMAVKSETECGVLNDNVNEIKGALHGK